MNAAARRVSNGPDAHYEIASEIAEAVGDDVIDDPGVTAAIERLGKVSCGTSWPSSRSGRFRPDYVGQLGTYVALVDDQVRVAGTHAATVGIQLCSARNEQVVRYALSGSRSPMAVAGYTYEALPQEAQAALPAASELQALL